MPTLVIDSRDRRKVDDLLRFVRSFVADLSVEGRMVFAVEIVRLLKPELDELKRRAAQSGKNSAGGAEPCCECGKEYPRADLVILGTLYCPECRLSPDADGNIRCGYCGRLLRSGEDYIGRWREGERWIAACGECYKSKVTEKAKQP